MIVNVLQYCTIVLDPPLTNLVVLHTRPYPGAFSHLEFRVEYRSGYILGQRKRRRMKKVTH
jgi:hypothetical protein